MKAFPHYPHTLEGNPFSVGDDMKINGLPMKSGYFRTKDTVRQIVNFYMGVWETQGFTPEERYQDDELEAVVSIIDTDKHQSLAVIISDQGSERVVMPTVTVIPGLTDNENTYSADMGDTNFRPPLPPGAKIYHNQEMNTQGLGSASQIYIVPIKIADAIEFYHKVMPQMGFQLEDSNSKDDLEMLFFRAGKVSINISFNVMNEDPPTTMLGITYLEEP